MTKKIFVLVAAVMALPALAACSDVAGTPNPTKDSSSSPTSGTSALPKRPAELKLDGVDPCKLLTAAQMTEIKVAETRPRQSKAVDQVPSPGCAYDNNLQYTYTVATVTGKGVQYWLAEGGNVEPKVVDVSGFGAVQITFLGTDNVDCAIAVDVAEGQQLFMDYTPTAKKGESQQQMCDNVKRAAVLALDTLKTLK